MYNSLISDSDKGEESTWGFTELTISLDELDEVEFTSDDDFGMIPGNVQPVVTVPIIIKLNMSAANFFIQNPPVCSFIC